MIKRLLLLSIALALASLVQAKLKWKYTCDTKGSLRNYRFDGKKVKSKRTCRKACEWKMNNRRLKRKNFVVWRKRWGYYECQCALKWNKFEKVCRDEKPKNRVIVIKKEPTPIKDAVEDIVEDVVDAVQEQDDSVVLKTTSSSGNGYDVVQERVTVGGYNCGGKQTAAVWRPRTTQIKFPLISFAHGWTQGGDKIVVYDDMMTELASRGYIVLAPMSARIKYCNLSDDQYRTIEWAKSNRKYKNLINWNKKVGLMGYSMGGASTNVSAGKKWMVQKYNIGAAVSLHPAKDPKGAPSKVPIFYAAGSKDTLTPSRHIKKMYKSASGVQAVYANLEGAVHGEVYRDANNNGKLRWTPYIVAMFNCHLKGRLRGCRKIYGNSADLCSLCNCSSMKMKHCYSKGGQKKSSGFLALKPKQCKLDFDNWLGSPAFMFSDDDPTDIDEYQMLITEGFNKYCLLGTKSIKNCFRKSGNKLTNVAWSAKYKEAELNSNGDFVWQNGKTTRLQNPCPPEPACELERKYMGGKNGRSYLTYDLSKKTVDEVRFTKASGNRVCSNGSTSGRNCYWKNDNRLQSKKYPYHFGYMTGDGNIRWSFGYTTIMQDSLCTNSKVASFVRKAIQSEKCSINFKDWLGKPAFSFAGDNTSAVTEFTMLVPVSRTKYCFRGTKYHNCYYKKGNRLINYKFSIFLKSAVIKDNGDIKWEQGPWTTRIMNPCTENSLCKVTAAKVRGKKGYSWRAGDVSKTPVDKFKITKKLCSWGTKSGRNCFKVKKGKLVNTRYPWIFGQLKKNGDIHWSHGFVTRFSTPICKIF